MNDLTPTIAPKSDQMNADDLIGRNLTIEITKVSVSVDPTQPVSVNYKGDNGKPYKPCKSMRRVLVSVWGGDGNAYVGRKLTVYRDDKVTFGKDTVGGIRISHMSHIDKPVTLALTATRGSRKPFTVQPLTKAPAVIIEAAPQPEMGVADIRERARPLFKQFKEAKTQDEIDGYLADPEIDAILAALKVQDAASYAKFQPHFTKGN